MSEVPPISLLELFSSFQGEGPRVGERQIFVRLAGCDLKCAYCDTPFRRRETARVETAPDRAREEYPSSSVAASDLLAWIERLDTPKGLHRTVSITGGEPLLHLEAVRAVAEGARRLGMRAHLETGGHRSSALREVLDALDEVSPDLKLESATWEPTPWEGHRETLALLAEHDKALAVKAVVASGTTEVEIDRIAELVQSLLPEVPLILQPVTLHGEGPEPPSALHLKRLHVAARRIHADVRAIPQAHRILGVR